MTRLYRGWTITGTTIATQMAQAGLLIYGFSALALPLEREFGTSRAEVMIAATCLSLASSALAPVAGWLVDRGSVRRLMLFGAAMVGAGFAVVAVAQTIWHVWLAFALLLPFANVLLGQITSATLITRWFEKRRGRAMGVSSLGTSLGGFVFPVLLATIGEAEGWRTAALACGLATSGLLVLLIALTVRDRPEGDENANERGEATLQKAASGSEEPLTTIQILAMPAFWIITVAVGLKIATYFALINNLAGLAEGMGLDAVIAASMVSVMSFTSMGGKVVIGWLSERFSARWLFVVALAMTVASFLLLLVTNTIPVLVVVCLLLGLSTGGMFPLWSIIVGQQFGERSFGKALGLTNLVMVPLTASASPLAGLAYDRTGGYDAAIWGAVAILSLATVLAAFLREPHRHP